MQGAAEKGRDGALIRIAAVGVVRVRGWCYFKLPASHCLQLAYKGNREIVIIKIDKEE